MSHPWEGQECHESTYLDHYQASGAAGGRSPPTTGDVSEPQEDMGNQRCRCIWSWISAPLTYFWVAVPQVLRSRTQAQLWQQCDQHLDINLMQFMSQMAPGLVPDLSWAPQNQGDTVCPKTSFFMWKPRLFHTQSLDSSSWPLPLSQRPHACPSDPSSELKTTHHPFSSQPSEPKTTHSSP